MLNETTHRNVVQIARSLAKSNGMKVNGNYISQSLKTFASSLDKLKQMMLAQTQDQ
jgi:hypothetical protein